MNVLGIDVGATAIRAAAVDVTTGRIARLESTATRPARGGRAVLADCVALAESIGRDATSVRGVSVGVCELVDREGRVTSAYSFDWRDVDVAGAFGSLGRAHVESDVRAAARAEALFGAGRPFDSFLYVNAGSGVSSSFVINGVPLPGANGNAILIGGGPLNVEEIAGGVGIARAAGVETAVEADRRATAGDEAAEDALLRGGTALGRAIAFAVNLLDPEGVVVGGGVVLGSAPFRSALVDALRLEVWADGSRDVPLVDSELGAHAGVIGAALAGAGSLQEVEA